MTQSLAIPGAIVVAGLLIASAVTFSGASQPVAHDGQVAQGKPESIRVVGDSDHVRGNKDARITITEYSDYECPFCARFHPTLKRIVDENSDVKWVFRNFPLSSIHSRAFDAAVAAECAAQIGGNETYWKYSDALFENQGELGDALYERLAEELTIDADAFRACRGDSKTGDKIEADSAEAIAAGGRGTPFSILTTASGAHIPFSGALPYEDVKRLVEQALAN